MNLLYPLPGCRMERVWRAGTEPIHLLASGLRPGGRCPECRQPGTAVHSRYLRRPADLPTGGRGVCLHLRVRRFFCRNPGCPWRTFAERLPALIAPRARRTLRLTRAQAAVGVEVGDEAGARLLE